MAREQLLVALSVLPFRHGTMTTAMANGIEEGAPRASTSSLSPSSSFNASRAALAPADDGEYVGPARARGLLKLITAETNTPPYQRTTCLPRRPRFRRYSPRQISVTSELSSTLLYTTRSEQSRIKEKSFYRTRPPSCPSMQSWSLPYPRSISSPSSSQHSPMTSDLCHLRSQASRRRVRG